MGVRAKWLVDAARLTGYPVNVLPGCFGRGHGDFRVLEGVVGHHTAGPKTGDYPSLNVVTYGRADLLGPLSNYGLSRSGMIQCIADGVCWHAGASQWAGFTDLNDEFIGIEAESVGSMDDWTAAQRDCYPRLVAAILYYMRRDATRFAGHKEVCLPAGRKIDPAFWNLADFRTKVAWYLADPLNRIPRFKNVTPPTTVAGKSGGTVIPLLLPRTEVPKDLTPATSKDWPWREEVIDLGFPGGWRGRCVLRLSFGHPGGRVFRAHFDIANGAVKVVDVPGVPAWPGHWVDPAYVAGGRWQIEAPTGPTALMLTYAAPGGASLNIEWEK